MSEFESPEEEAARILFGTDESPGPELDDETEMENYLNMIKALMRDPVIADLAIKSGWMEKAGAYIDDQTVIREGGRTITACLYFAEDPLADFPQSDPLYRKKEVTS